MLHVVYFRTWAGFGSQISDPELDKLNAIQDDQIIARLNEWFVVHERDCADWYKQSQDRVLRRLQKASMRMISPPAGPECGRGEPELLFAEDNIDPGARKPLSRSPGSICKTVASPYPTIKTPASWSDGYAIAVRYRYLSPFNDNCTGEFGRLSPSPCIPVLGFRHQYEAETVREKLDKVLLHQPDKIGIGGLSRLRIRFGCAKQKTGGGLSASSRTTGLIGEPADILDAVQRQSHSLVKQWGFTGPDPATCKLPVGGMDRKGVKVSELRGVVKAGVVKGDASKLKDYLARKSLTVWQEGNRWYVDVREALAFFE